MIKKCEYCGEEFKTKHSEQKCCSRECDSKNKTTKIKLVCPICNAEFYKKPSEVDKIKGKPCCSKKCKYISLQKYNFLNKSVQYSPIYKIWNAMIQRCYNVKQKAYVNYGNRGIKVCSEWQNFENFYNWAIANGYKDKLSIERINVNSDYTPNNCKWIKLNEQCKNKRNTIWVEYNNSKMCLKDVALLENVDYKDLWQVFKRKQDIQEALKVCKLHNQGLIEANKSGVSGVGFYNNGWTVTYKKKYIGRYKTLNEAIKAKKDFINKYYNKVT